MRKIQIHLLLLCSLCMADTASAFLLRGLVVEVVDGDSVKIESKGVIKEYHLQEIDSPQLGQRYGAEARRLTASLVLGKEVTIDCLDELRAKDIIAPDGTSLKWKLLAAGLAWYPKNHNRKDVSLQTDFLAKQEFQARKTRAGLWADPAPTPPWAIHKGQEAMPEVIRQGKVSNLGSGASSSKAASRS